MAIEINSVKYGKKIIDSKTIIGVIGNNRESFIKSLSGKNIYYLNKYNNFEKIIIDDSLLEYRKILDIDNIFNDNMELSHSRKKLLQYYLMISSNANILVINEPYLDLDYSEIKKINRLFNKLVKDGKTIIISSCDINIIYSICKKVLLVNNDSIYYSSIKCLNDIELLNKYNIEIPNIVEFVLLAKKKNIKIPFSKDVRDLIKDVYRNVSKK